MRGDGRALRCALVLAWFAIAVAVARAVEWILDR